MRLNKKGFFLIEFCMYICISFMLISSCMIFGSKLLKNTCEYGKIKNEEQNIEEAFMNMENKINTCKSLKVLNEKNIEITYFEGFKEKNAEIIWDGGGRLLLKYLEYVNGKKCYLNTRVILRKAKDVEFKKVNETLHVHILNDRGFKYERVYKIN